MKSWYKITEDITLKDGSTIKEDRLTFETTDKNISKRVETFFKSLMDEPQGMDKCHKCKWWNYSYGCSNKKGICDFEPIADTPPTDCPYKEYPCDVCDEQTDCPWR